MKMMLYMTLGADQTLLAPRAVVPEIRIDRPAAFITQLGKRPDIP